MFYFDDLGESVPCRYLVGEGETDLDVEVFVALRVEALRIRLVKL